MFKSKLGKWRWGTRPRGGKEAKLSVPSRSLPPARPRGAPSQFPSLFIQGPQEMRWPEEKEEEEEVDEKKDPTLLCCVYPVAYSESF